MNRVATTLAAVAATGLAALAAFAAAAPADAATARPVVSSLSASSGVYWGGTTITVHGQNLTGARAVNFGTAAGAGIHVSSATALTVVVPWHDYATVDVQVVTAGGTSATSAADHFRFVAPTMDTPIQGGLTGHQEQAISASVRARHVTPGTAARSAAWTAAMGTTAVNRALSWLGLPYSWAGGNGSGPTTGVCTHNGGDLDCNIIGFDCSGLALYGWSPYVSMDHFAASQYSEAGRFHPTVGELTPGDLVFFAGSAGGEIDHVVMYIGNGQVVEAPESGEVVRISKLSDLMSWSYLAGATRPTSTGQQSPGPALSSYPTGISINGGQVTVTGSNLATTTSVVIGGTRIYSFATRTASTLVFTAPAHAAGASTLEIDNSWGAVTKAINYGQPPQLSTISSPMGVAAGGNTVTLTGTNLTAVTALTVGTTKVAFTRTGSTGLTLTMPAHSSGSVSVVASSVYGTDHMNYTYVGPIGGLHLRPNTTPAVR